MTVNILKSLLCPCYRAKHFTWIISPIPESLYKVGTAISEWGTRGPEIRTQWSLHHFHLTPRSAQQNGCVSRSLFFYSHISADPQRVDSYKLTETAKAPLPRLGSVHLKAKPQANASCPRGHITTLPAPFPLFLLISGVPKARVMRDRDMPLPVEKEKGLLFVQQNVSNPHHCRKS